MPNPSEPIPSEPEPALPGPASGARPGTPARASAGEAARWFALGVLALAAIAGLFVAVFFRQPREALIRSVTRSPAPRAAPGTSPTRPDPPPEATGRSTPEPAAQGGAATEAPAPAKASTFGLVRINSATQAELELLPGIGPAMAQRILAHRAAHGPFRTLQDLDAIRGIGPRTLDKLGPLISFE